MNKYSSIFSQWRSLFPRLEFERLVRQTGAEYAAKGFSSWGQYVAMLFCQLGQAHSLREICSGLASCFGKLRHLGIARGPKRSTLAYANEHRSWELFQKVFYGLLSRCQGEFLGRSKFRFKNKLMSFEATVIELWASLFDGAKFRRTKGAVKLHLLLDHEGYLPQYAHITEGKVHEVNVPKIQIWTALIAILLLKYLKMRSRYNWSLSNLVALLRLNLFSYRDLWEWIDRPIEPPPVIQEAEPLALSLV